MTVDRVRNGAEGSAALAHAEHALVLLDRPAGIVGD
jgi:hypothetical protein